MSVRRHLRSLGTARHRVAMWRRQRRAGQSAMEARAFLRTRVITLAARARRLSRIDYATTGIRPQDLPYAPSPEHFQAANARLASIDRQIAGRLEIVQRN